MIWSASGYVEKIPPFYSRRQQRRFIADYVFHKTFGLMRDLRRDRLKMLTYEVAYSLSRALGRNPPRMTWLGIVEVRSKFGRFCIRPGTLDQACASPAFERMDVDQLLRRLQKAEKHGRGIVFIDIGADIGTYSISVANRVSSARVIAFEPVKSSCSVLERNIELNKLNDRVGVVRSACGETAETSTVILFDSNEPGSSGIRADLVKGRQRETVPMTTLDAAITLDDPIDFLAIKMDVEGFEIPVLKGGADLLESAGYVLLLVEDFVDASVIDYLRETGWTFLDKVTPYNSFWSKGSAAAQ